MGDWWTETWSFGTGRSRTYCGIAETDEGYAVDVFSGDTCVDSRPCRTRAEALRLTREFKESYGMVPLPERHPAQV